jgi:S1-C subfamily serine protease
MLLSIGNVHLVSGLGRIRLAVSMLMVCAAASVRAATLDPSVLPKVEAATFEVVQAKPVNDPLTYEKPLPLDLLPYQERTDKYYSIGTAFAIGHNRYVTAGHVLLAGLDSLWGAPALRDSKGNVYAIDKIEKFGLRRDFVVFTLAKPPGEAALGIDAKPALNAAVYAVGNALGTGVVIRDGLYTSDTPEQQDGAWKWMRFSAAASPGNSGGPLLDQNGKVIGLVLAKSPNENLNYALPISEVLNAPDGRAVLDARTSYSLDVLDGAVQNDILQAKFSLPLSLADFYRNFEDLVSKHEDAQQKALLTREAANLFPNGPGSARVLNQQSVTYNFPALVARNSNDEWAVAESNTTRVTLEDNGYIDAGVLGHEILFRIRRPDNLDPAVFYGDAKVRMDLMTKTGVFQRPIGTQKIKITSMGKPESESEYVDRWQRRWQVDVWTMPFLNTRMVAYTLPLPDGCIVMLRPTPASFVHDTMLDFSQITNFVLIGYNGTLAQWKQYLAIPRLLPDVLKDMHITFDYGQSFTYTSPRIAFSYAQALQPIAPNSLLSLAFNYFPDHDHVVWDVNDVHVWKNDVNGDANRISIQRYHAPPAGLDNDLTALWTQVLQHTHPYDGVAYSEDDTMEIKTAAVPPVSANPSVLYTGFYAKDGNQSQAFMKDKLDQLLKNLKVTEH